MGKLCSLVEADLLASGARKVGVLHVLLYFLKSEGFRLLLLYRLAHVCHVREMRLLAVLFVRIQRLFSNVHIEPGAVIGGGVKMPHPLGIVIGGRARIGSNCTIYQGVTLGGSLGKVVDERTQPTVGDNAHLGPGCVLLGPIVVGDSVVVGANAVVVKDVVSFATVVGVPAVAKKKL